VDTQNFRFSVLQPPSSEYGSAGSASVQVRSEKLLKDLPLTRLGRPSERRQVRKRFGLESQLREKFEICFIIQKLRRKIVLPFL
jgi:hypothetical protein